MEGLPNYLQLFFISVLFVRLNNEIFNKKYGEYLSAKEETFDERLSLLYHGNTSRK